MIAHSISAAIAITMIFVGSAFFESSRRADRLEPIMPPSELKHFSLGYQENLADGLWLRVIQDMDLCEKVPGGFVHTDERRAAVAKGLISSDPACEKSWVYQMLNTISELAPKFRMVYAAGAITLSILVDDREGAALLFEKGMREFPTDWDLAYRAAYHYLYEVKDEAKAAECLTRAANNGGPSWFLMLAGRLYSKVGRAQLAKSVLEEALAMTPDGPGAEKIRQRLKEANLAISEGENSAGKSEHSPSE